MKARKEKKRERREETRKSCGGNRKKVEAEEAEKVRIFLRHVLALIVKLLIEKHETKSERNPEGARERRRRRIRKCSELA